SLDLAVEAERYEFFEQPLYHFEPDRREFFGVLGAGIVVALLVEDALAQPPRGRGGPGGAGPQEIGAWLHGGKEGQVTVYPGRAAERLKVEPKMRDVADSKIAHPDSRQAVTFGQLTEGKKLVQTVGQSAAVTPPSQWKVAGQSVAKVNARDLVTGKHQYASDI